MATPQSNDADTKNKEEQIQGKVNTVHIKNKCQNLAYFFKQLHTMKMIPEHNQLVYMLICPILILKMHRR